MCTQYLKHIQPSYPLSLPPPLHGQDLFGIIYEYAHESHLFWKYEK
jgi:hypothetical protein